MLGKKVEYPLAEQVTFYTDYQTMHTSGMPSDWFGELIVVTLENRNGKDVVISLRPPSPDQRPSDPPGTPVTGKFVGWKSDRYPDGQIFLEIAGKKETFPAAEQITWYDVHGSKIKRNQDRAFLQQMVTVLLVNNGKRDEATIIRPAK